MKNKTCIKPSNRNWLLTVFILHLQRYQFQVFCVAKFQYLQETYFHAERVGGYASIIYETWAHKHGVPQGTIDTYKNTLRKAAMFHDIGKVAISGTILNKIGSLTVEEYDMMKQHTVLGAWLFSEAQSEFGKIAAQITLNHHEHWDGSGYPGHVDPRNGQAIPGYENEQGKARGKQGAEIPLFARIVAIADVYDALLSQRVYKSVWKESDAFNTLDENAGTHFDPEIVGAFFDNLDKIRTITRHFSDTMEQNRAPAVF